MWYVHSDLWLTIRDCFISTPELTNLWDEAIYQYEIGNYYTFMEMHAQIAQYMPDQFGPCMSYPDVARDVNKILAHLEEFTSL